MELLSRYRNVSVLLLVIFAQLVLLAYQVKGNQDVRLIRVWAVSAITPLARVAESVRSGTLGVLEEYVLLHNLRDENRQLKLELGRLKLDNEFLKTQLETADRIKALSAFQARSPSRTVASRVIATGTGGNARVVFIDRGSRGGVMRGMAVITPDGIVGKVLAAYPTASQVLLITDPTFAAGVISQKHHVRGTVRGQGHGDCIVDYIQNEEQVDLGEQFFTSGDDGVFPKGLPVGKVTVVRASSSGSYKQVFLEPSGLQAGLEEVLVVLEGAHQPIPDLTTAAAEVHLQPPPPGEQVAGGASPAGGPPAFLKTDADKLAERYKKVGEAQGHVFGAGLPGSKPPDFNLNPEEAARRAATGTKSAGAKPASTESAKPVPGNQTGAPGAAVRPERPPQAEGLPHVVAPVKPRPASPTPASPGTGTPGAGNTGAPGAAGRPERPPQAEGLPHAPAGSTGNKPQPTSEPAKPAPKQ